MEGLNACEIRRRSAIVIYYWDAAVAPRDSMRTFKLLTFFCLLFSGIYLFGADVLLKNVTVYDGTGKLPFHADPHSPQSHCDHGHASRPRSRGGGQG
jgi:hypothetical protein